MDKAMGMHANRRVRYPKSSYTYGTYGWHNAWTVDLVNLEATHRSGLVFKFTSGADGDAKPPLGGKCPCGAWYGELRGGADSLPVPYKQHIAIRLCLEAIEIFSGMAAYACQDCNTDTIGGDYYMVHDTLWNKVHPKNAGMLCLRCLEKRVGRRIKLSDFTNAPINGNQVARFCAEN